MPKLGTSTRTSFSEMAQVAMERQSVTRVSSRRSLLLTIAAAFLVGAVLGYLGWLFGGKADLRATCW
jgi:hypothetical protein